MLETVNLPITFWLQIGLSLAMLGGIGLTVAATKRA